MPTATIFPPRRFRYPRATDPVRAAAGVRTCSDPQAWSSAEDRSGGRDDRITCGSGVCCEFASSTSLTVAASGQPPHASQKNSFFGPPPFPCATTVEGTSRSIKVFVAPSFVPGPQTTLRARGTPRATGERKGRRGCPPYLRKSQGRAAKRPVARVGPRVRPDVPRRPRAVPRARLSPSPVAGACPLGPLGRVASYSIPREHQCG